jgi:hypothetical protein
VYSSAEALSPPSSAESPPHAVSRTTKPTRTAASADRRQPLVEVPLEVSGVDGAVTTVLLVRTVGMRQVTSIDM